MRIVRNNDESGDSLERHFRELRNLEAMPSDNLWDKVEDRLDEDRERVKHDHWYKALIMLLIPFTLINMLFTYNLGSYDSVSEVMDDQALLQRSSPQGNDFPNNPDASGGWGNFFNGGFYPVINEPARGNDFEKAKESIADAERKSFFARNFNSLKEEETEVALIDVASALLIDNKATAMSAVRDDGFRHPSEKAITERIPSMKGFHVGIEGGVNNSWLLHKDNTLHPLIGNMIHRKFDVGASWGISAGYDFSQRFGIEAEWIIKSLQGQTYWENRYNKILINGQVNLQYMHVPVMFKYKWSKIGRHSQYPRALNLVAGVQYSRLRDAEVVQNGLDIDGVKELFNRDEMGLLLGVEYDMFVHRNYFLSLGARASISTDARAFPYFNSKKTETYNVLFGMNASFNFMMRKKK